MSIGAERDRVRRVVRDTVEGQGYELVDLEFTGSGKNTVLRIYIDKPAGITHRDCELISEQAGTVLDVEDAIPYAYTLEVSSPGLNRKLAREGDYTRFAGKLARIQTRIPLQHQKVFKGRLRGFQNGNIRLEMPKGELLEIPLDVIQEARLEFDWEEEMARSKAEAESEREER